MVNSAKHITTPLEISMALCNDYFRYAKEKNESAGNGLSTVEFVMQEKVISQEAALEFVKAKIIAEEETHKSALKDGQRTSNGPSNYGATSRLCGSQPQVGILFTARP
jgi:hypothetical protein